MRKWLIVLVLALAAALSIAQAEHAHNGPGTRTGAQAATISDRVLEISQRTLPVRTGIGAAHDNTATMSPKAQALHSPSRGYRFPPSACARFGCATTCRP